MTLNDLECPIHLKVRLMDGTLDVYTFVAGFGFDHMHRCSQKGRRWAGGPSLPHVGS